MLTLLHTSDWHLGRRLYGKPRYDEFKQFLDWQLQTLREQKVDVLLIAGDIFDTTAPSNQAQNLYYDFLSQVCDTDCRHVIIVAGNHDSASFLEAPKQLLKSFNIHIIGSMTDTPTDEVITLLDKAGQPELIVMAVPYLRDRDVRTVGHGERLDDKERKLAQGIKAHYAQIADIAIAQQAQLKAKYKRSIPIVATGHLFTVGGQTMEGDGVRDLYVGSLGSIGAEIFHPQIDYVALGHLHIPQAVGGQPHIRYAGSPIAMGFGESRQQKQVHLLRFDANPDLLSQPLQTLTIQKKPLVSAPTPVKKRKMVSHASMDLFADEELPEPSMLGAINAEAGINAEVDAQASHKAGYDTPSAHLSGQPNGQVIGQPYNLAKLSDTTLLQSLPVPVFQPIQTLKGDWQTIKTSLHSLKKSQQSVWLEVVYDGQEVVGDLSEKIAELVKGSRLEVLRIKNQQKRDQVMQSQRMDESLEELNPTQVFERCLIAHQVLEEQKPMLWSRYTEVLESLQGGQQ
ncbi:exonuclease SbcCD subunit D C-terminal domain-containing protein [Moraxella osloensis]|nr:exonuclease SbcCD subunit D C-terminal domain-containing protein [Moraxella osloensis]QRO14310.1 exonuclease SbcCD subunit D C-terminal domain-containing protein [Moraxella osloensis]